MTKRQGQWALITGASGGIGRDLTTLMAREGYHVILVARSRGKMERMAERLTAEHGVSTRVLAHDLSDPAAPAAIFAALQGEDITVDVLVNNAGFATYGFFHELERERELAMMQVNMMALTDLTRLLLPGMVARGYGRVLNVASTAAFQPGPLMAVYYASKAYVLHFSEAIANELEGSGVTVTALCPGPTASGFQSRADMEDSKLVQNGLMSSAAVAVAGYEAMMDGETVVVPGLSNKLGTLAPRFVPRDTATRIVRNMQERTGAN